MSTNLEIKASYPDLAEARRIARQLGASFVAREQQRDTYFQVPAGRLKLREIGPAAWLIPYLRPDQSSAKLSDYELIPVTAVEHTRALLTAILGVSVVVEKQREIYLLDNIRLHLDEVSQLGCFLELEAVFDATEPQVETINRARVAQLMTDFKLAPDALIRGSYHDLLRAQAHLAAPPNLSN